MMTVCGISPDTYSMRRNERQIAANINAKHFGLRSRPRHVEQVNIPFPAVVNVAVSGAKTLHQRQRWQTTKSLHRLLVVTAKQVKYNRSTQIYYKGKGKR